MARPRKEDQEFDLHPFDQLAKSIDLGDKHPYRFESKETIRIASDTALEIRSKLMQYKPQERGEFCIRMMANKAAFYDVLDTLDVTV